MRSPDSTVLLDRLFRRSLRALVRKFLEMLTNECGGGDMGKRCVYIMEVFDSVISNFLDS